MIDRFYSKESDPGVEASYEAWISSHAEDGYVFNQFGGTTSHYNIIHRADCWVLMRQKDEGGRTHVRKVCATDLTLLEEDATDQLGSEKLWRYCKICTPDTNVPVPEGSESASLPLGRSAEDHQMTREDGSLCVGGSPAVWLSDDEEQWKNKIKKKVGAWAGSKPEFLDMSFFLAEEKLYRRDLDNLITPVLDALKDGEVVEAGFNEIGTIKARKCIASAVSKEGLAIRKESEPPPLDEQLAGVLVEVQLEGKDEETVKKALYRNSAELYWSRPELAVPAQCPISLDIRVEIVDPGRRKSIKALLKPCIDGLEPILSRPDGLQPLTLSELDRGEWRTLAPQDEMVVDLRVDVRGGSHDRLSVVVSLAH